MKLFSKLRRYCLAPISCAIALAVARPLDAPASCFSIAVMVSSFYGGRGPGLLSVGLSALAFDYYFLPPLFSLYVAPFSYLRFAVFLGSILLIFALIEVKRRVEVSRHEQASLLDLTHDSIFVRDMHSVISYWNHGAEVFYGWTAEKAIGRTSHQLLRTVFPKPLDEIHADLLRTGRWEGELLHTKADGTQVVVASRWSLRRDNQQRPLAVLETNNDITERKQAGEKLRKSEEQLRLIVDTIPGLVYTSSPTGEVELVNQPFVEYTGKTLEEYKASPGVHPDDVESTKRLWRYSLETGDPCLHEFRLRRSDGVYRWFDARSLPLRDNEGRIIRWYTLVTDIEDRKNAEEALRRTQARLSRATQIATVGELAAAIAHEVNQPLSAVVANGHAGLRWLSADPPNLPKAREAAERIVRDGKGAGEVVRRVRALFKRTAGEKGAINMNEVIGEVIHLLRGDIARKGIIVETNLDKNLPLVVGDRIQLQQVLLNLVLNGLEAMDSVGDRPKILFIRSAEENTDAVLVEVRDHGVGIENPEQAFESFFTTKENGMGMGLAICRSIIDAHQGRLWIASNGGSGATVCFTIPLQSSGAPSSPAAPSFSRHTR